MEENLLLIKPTQQLEKELLTYLSDFKDNLDDLHGASSLEQFKDMKDWINHLYLYENRDTMPNKSFVPGHQYILIRQSDSKVLGMLHLRLELNDYLLNYGGHIGYSIAPSERKKGYGSIMLKEALHKARDFQLEKVLITCDDDNPGSYKVIENNQGIIENKIFDEATGKDVRRYWIEL